MARREFGRWPDGAGKEITQLVVTGAGNKDIAWQLGLTEQTIKNNLRKIFGKLRVGNRVELAMMAVDLHLPTRTGTHCF